ncbi:MAG: S8 family serine peptidase, partial [Candidatus Syntrophosphaera sp.]
MPGRDGKFTQSHRQWGLHLWFLLEFESDEDIRDIIMSYREMKDMVEWAEPEYKKRLSSAESTLVSAMEQTLARWTPNDPYYGYQWHYHNTGQTGGTVDADIDLPEAWDLEKGHPDVVVAVIDQGIQTNHPDLAGNMWINSGETPGNGIDDDSNGYVDDIYGYNFAGGTGTISAGDHGCHTGGTIGAVTNNGTGVSGIAGGSGSGDGVRLMSCQVFSTSNGGFELAPIYAADNGAAISQNSWSYTSEGVYDQSVLDAIDYFNANGGGAVMTGGITIFAAGNDGSSGNWYPACYSGCFAVAATNHEDVRSYYSNYDTWVDVSAPGGETYVEEEGVLSAVSGSSYAFYQGTSMACPHASGVAALVVSYLHRAGSSITNTELANLLRNTTDDHYYANPSYVGMLGTGRINAHSALLAADPTLPACTITAPSNYQVFDLNSTIAVNATATDSDGYLTQVAFYIDDEATPSYTDYSSPYAWNWDTTGVSGGNHAIKAIATDNDGNTAQSTVTVILLAPPDEGFESGGFSSYPWGFGGNTNWFVQSAETFSGTYAAQSGAITHNETSSMSVTLNITSAGNISFYKKVSSEASWDFLRFYIDGTMQDEWSGSGSWSYETYPVTTGSHTFSWSYDKDGSVSSGSDCAWIDHIIFPSYTLPSEYYPPQNLAAAGANGVVYLTWDAPAYGTPTGYRIYKDGSLLTTVTGLSHDDHAVVNGTTYSYYLTAVYSGGVSDPTPIVSATPNLITSVIIGDGTDSNGSTYACPINVYYESLHGQSVYTAAELNAAGLFGPAEITEIGFNVTQTPNLAMPNYVVRMGHTTVENVTDWITASALTTVWTSASYQPTQTGWNMFTLSTPFIWNGTDNLVVDTGYGLIGEWNSSGTTQYTSVNNGYRYVRNDYNDQTNVFSGGYTSNYRPNVKLSVSVEPEEEPEIVVDPLSLDFGEIEVGQSSIQQFTIQNTGTATLTGSITTPAGYTVFEAGARSNEPRENDRSAGLRTAVSDMRNTVSFSIAPGASVNYDLTFSPTEASAYNGNVVITSNDSDEPITNIAVTGNGFIPPSISVDDNTLAASLNIGAEDTDSFIISNLGSQELTFVLSESPAVDWFSFDPGSGAISGSGSQTITGTFSAAGMAPGTYQTTLLIDSNDPANPQLSISVNMEVVNITPTIDLPLEGFSFDMNGSLVVDFAPYVDDADGHALALGYSGNTD